MAASAAEIAQVRRMVAEPLTTTYTDVTIQGYIEKYPLIDIYGYSSTDDYGITNPSWTATYDLNAAAADIWDEKTALLAAKFDFAADGASFSHSQAYQQAAERARYFRSRRSPRKIVLEPAIDLDLDDEIGQVANL